MPSLLIDTNVLISWFGGLEESVPLAGLLENGENELFTSIICVTEFLAGCDENDARAFLKIIEREEIGVIFFDDLAQAASAALLRKKLNVKMPDAIIAATALHRDMALFTLDREFIRKIAGTVKLYL
jgi:predicted nucleic acid-binding protein